MNTALRIAIGFCIFLVVALLVSISDAQAIVNIEDSRIEDPKPGLHGAIDIKLKFKEQQDKRYLKFGFKVKAFIVSDDLNQEIIYLKSQDITKSNDSIVNDDSYYHIRYLRSLTPNLYDSGSYSIETFIQNERQLFRERKSRRLGGIGGRYIVISKPGFFKEALGFGGLYEIIELNGLSSSIDKVRLNFYYSLKSKLHLVDPRVVIATTIYLQPWVQDFTDINVLLQSKLSLNITDDILLSTSLNLERSKLDEKVIRFLAFNQSIGIRF